MSRISKNVVRPPHNNRIEIKSKLDAEFRRFSIDRSQLTKFEEFHNLIERVHKLNEIAFILFYTDPIHGDLLPINNDDNFTRAVNSLVERPMLRIIVQKKGESCDELNGGYETSGKRKKFLAQYLLLPSVHPKSKPHISISFPEDFRQVSSIIDVDIVPEACRRVRLVKHGSEKPLGFYIRDGSSVRVTSHGLEKVPGIFISRLVPGGLAESTGLLAVNDEVIEVNGIEVNGKSLDEVTDMMVANSSNLIITIRPANQTSVGFPRRGSIGHSSQMSHGSHNSNQSLPSDDDHFDDDEIRDHTNSACFEGTVAEKKSASEDDGIVTL